MHLASKSKWRNPPTGSLENEAVRRQFYRFRETLGELIGIPGDAFDTEGDDWKPNFNVIIHGDLQGLRNEIVAAKMKQPDVFEHWHPMSRGNSAIE